MSFLSSRSTSVPFILKSNQAGERKNRIAIESINPRSAVYFLPVIWLVGQCCMLRVANVTYHHRDKQPFTEAPLYFPTSTNCEVSLFAKG